MKSRTKTLAGRLMVNKVLEKLWMHLIVDFITKLMLVAGKDAILVVCNRLPKMAFCDNYKGDISRRIGEIV